MPADAPEIKIENTKALGAEVKLYDRYREDREAIARAIAGERGFVLVPPYDDPRDHRRPGHDRPRDRR